MRKIIGLTAFIAFACVSLAFANSFTADSDTTTEVNGRVTNVMHSKYFYKDGKFRVESDMAGGTSEKMIMIFDGVNMYQYFPSRNMAMIMPNMQNTMKGDVDRISNKSKVCDCESLRAEGYRLTNQGADTIEGKPYLVCEYESTGGQRKTISKLWVLQGACCLGRMETISDGTKTTMRYYNLVDDAVLGDDLFMLPPGVSATTVGGMIKEDIRQSNIDRLKSLRPW